MSMTIEKIFDELWAQYTTLNPTADKIHKLLKSTDEQLLNDHVAFRTFKHPDFGIDHLSKVFKNLGYKDKGDYHFEVKKLYAKHFEHSDKSLPKVFISELLIENFSENLQNTFKNIATHTPIDKRTHDEVSFSGKHWDINYKTYQNLYKESPYAAWLYCFGFCANHFTINLNSSSQYQSLEELNIYLKQNGFTLNTSGGEIKGSKEVFLEQSSTMASEIDVTFSDGVYKVPSCYYEFARRYQLPNGELYQGFVANSADKIFESTDKVK